MFAHQVIDTYHQHKQQYDDDCPFGHYAYAAYAIQRAQHFHFGVSDDIIKLCKVAGKRVFEDYQYMKLPFKVVWFDCYCVADIESKIIRHGQDVADKFGVLITVRGDNSWHIIPFSHLKYTDTWQSFPIAMTTKKAGTQDMVGSVEAEWIIGPHIVEKYKSDGGIDVLRVIQNNIISFINSAVLLLNCKNISLELIKAPNKLNKKRKRNGKQELFDYHVLNVITPGQKQEYREKAESLSHVRVHLCRGHFKEYTPDHPLFGKLTGLYWWQPYVRGQNKDGIVMKDYKVSPQMVVNQ